MKHNVKFADSWQTLAYRDPEAYQLILRNTPKGRQYQQQQRQTQANQATAPLPVKKAYTIGFSKVASDYGVDPAALIKAAGLLNQYKNIKN